MLADTLDRPMTKRNDQPVKIDAGVLAKVRIAASYRGVSIAEWLSEVALAAALREIEEGHARVMKESQAKGKASK